MVVSKYEKKHASTTQSRVFYNLVSGVDSFSCVIFSFTGDDELLLLVLFKCACMIQCFTDI